MLQYVSYNDIKERIAFNFRVSDSILVLPDGGSRPYRPILGLRRKDEHWCYFVMLVEGKPMFLWQIRLPEEEFDYVDTLLRIACHDLGLIHERDLPGKG